MTRNVQGLPPDSASSSLAEYVAKSSLVRSGGSSLHPSIDAEAESDRLFLGGLEDFPVAAMPLLTPERGRFRCSRCRFRSNSASVVAEHTDHRHRRES